MADSGKQQNAHCSFKLRSHSSGLYSSTNGSLHRVEDTGGECSYHQSLPFFIHPNRSLTPHPNPAELKSSTISNPVHESRNVKANSQWKTLDEDNVPPDYFLWQDFGPYSHQSSSSLLVTSLPSSQQWLPDTTHALHSHHFLNLTFPHARSSMTFHSFHTAPKVQNSLPSELKFTHNLSSFKNSIKQLYTNNHFIQFFFPFQIIIYSIRRVNNTIEEPALSAKKAKKTATKKTPFA